MWWVYFLIGFIMTISLIKLLFPKPLIVRIVPTIENYENVLYIDEDKKIYKYDIDIK